MDREVFQPLAMTRTVLAETAGRDIATADYRPRTIVRNPLDDDDWSPPEYSCLAGAGAFASTPTDLVRLGSAMLKPRLLRRQSDGRRCSIALDLGDAVAPKWRN
jgi:CubicO group peptidase (beta-lactamase class C family)